MNNCETLFSSIHTHTLFCDGKNDIETMCRTAYEKKLCSIGFSAHAPVPESLGNTDWHIKKEKLNDYITEINAAKSRWKGKLNVFLGFEADYIKGIRSPSDNDLKELNADYIIGSVHYVVPANGAKPFTVDGSLEEFETGLRDGFYGNIESLMHCYYDAMAEMIEIGGFDILGHADLIKKNFNKIKFQHKETEYVRQKEIARALARACARACENKEIIVEVNTGGLNRGKINDVYPSESFLKYFNDYNVKMTITSDAHCAEHLDGNYNSALQALNSAGFSEHLILIGKNNSKLQWKTEKINKALD